MTSFLTFLPSCFLSLFFACQLTNTYAWWHGDVEGSVLVRIYGGPESRPEPVRNMFLGSGTRTGSIYGAGPGQIENDLEKTN